MGYQSEEHSSILWIGGAPDSGKSTNASLLARRLGFGVYHYDELDLGHHKRLALEEEHYKGFLESSLEERWLIPTPQELLDRSLRSFRDRLPLVLEDLSNLQAERVIIAEGFGFLPLLLEPILSGPNQAIWLIPTREFKLQSMQRRGKPSFQDAFQSEAAAKQATRNLIERDRMLAELIRGQADELEYRVLDIGQASTPEGVANEVERHFDRYLQTV